MATDRPILDLLTASSTPEWRLAASAVVVVLTALLARYAVPAAVGRTRRLADGLLRRGRVGEFLESTAFELPAWADGRYLVWGLQAALVVAEALALLVVWGLTGLAWEALVVLWGLTPGLARVALTVVLLVVAYGLVGVLEDFVDRVYDRSERLDRHQSEIVFRVLQVSLLVAVVLVVLTVWQVNLGGLLIGAGFLGIVVGMAARQTLGSLLAGFVLMFSRPFEVGDWIAVNDMEGVVTDITIVNTRLENFDGEYVVVPNDVIANSTIVNRTRKGRLRVRVEVGVDYGVEPGRAEEVAMAAIKDLDEVMSVPRPQVVPSGFGDSAILLELRFWIDKPSSRRRWRAKAAVIRAVYAAFEEADIKIPFPQRELSGRAETGGFRLAGRPGDPPELDASEAAED